MARQPIFDRRDQLHAYELLYRAGLGADSAVGVSPEQMSADVLAQAFLSTGIERITGGAKAFINFSRRLLLDGAHQPLDPGIVVVELLESITPDRDVIAACRELSALGFTLALDDYVHDASFDPLLRLARVVKLDVLGLSTEQIARRIEPLRPYGVQLLAERVETMAVRDACRALGFTFFQGHYYSRPQLVTQRELSSAHLAIIKLLNLLRDASSSDLDVERAFQADLGLTYKLLRSVNSAAVGGRGISSIRHALQLLGRAKLHQWLSLLFVRGGAGSGGTRAALAHVAVRRAHMCELLAASAGLRESMGALFMVGLLSTIDAVLGVPMDEVLARINLDPAVSDALLRRTGVLAPVLSLVEAYEKAEWTRMLSFAAGLGITGDAVARAYTTAIAWAGDGDAAGHR